MILDECIGVQGSLIEEMLACVQYGLHSVGLLRRDGGEGGSKGRVKGT